MLENFHLAVIVKKRANTRLYQVPLHQNLQHSLANSWEAQYGNFVDSVEVVDFNAGYNLEGHERFRLNNFEPPEWLAHQSSQTIERLGTINHDEEFLDSIAGIIAIARNAYNNDVMLFQNFKPSKVIRPKRTVLLKGKTYKSAEHPGLTLDEVLSAVYQPAERILLFNSFYTVNTFLPLADFYKEASEQEIVEILDHRLFNAENSDATAANASQWFRKRFAILRESGILEEYTANQIQLQACNHGVEICVTDDKILFPVEKVEAKRLLQFLCEELYRGPITNTLYETNSKKEAV
ncbi:MAG: hypothetical protein OXC13_19895 [Caldilineaceae bacterium]|nr:hypothetical protein [Caldilineaceae bacterium]